MELSSSSFWKAFYYTQRRNSIIILKSRTLSLDCSITFCLSEIILHSTCRKEMTILSWQNYYFLNQSIIVKLHWTEIRFQPHRQLVHTKKEKSNNKILTLIKNYDIRCVNEKEKKNGFIIYTKNTTKINLINGMIIFLRFIDPMNTTKRNRVSFPPKWNITEYYLSQMLYTQLLDSFIGIVFSLYRIQYCEI